MDHSKLWMCLNSTKFMLHQCNRPSPRDSSSKTTLMDLGPESNTQDKSTELELQLQPLGPTLRCMTNLADQPVPHQPVASTLTYQTTTDNPRRISNRQDKFFKHIDTNA